MTAAKFVEPSVSTTPGMPELSVEAGVPHIWLPDLDGAGYTPAKLVMALATLAVTHPDVLLDDTDTDGSGAYLAFRLPTQAVVA